MIPSLGKRQAPEPTENSEGRNIQLPFELIVEILNHLSLNGWRLMNQLSKPFARYTERIWKELSKQEGLYFSWPGCPLNVRPKEDMPYPEQTRYFQGKLLQDYFDSPAFSKSIYFEPCQSQTITVSCGKDPLQIYTAQAFGDKAKKLIKSLFPQARMYTRCSHHQLLENKQDTLHSIYYFTITPETKEQIEKRQKDLYHTYQSLKKRMIAFPFVGAYIWADLTYVASITPNHYFPLEDNHLFESNKTHSEDLAGNYLLKGLSCLTEIFKEAIIFYSPEKRLAVESPELFSNSSFLYLLKPFRVQFLHQSSTWLNQAITQKATIASQFVFKMFNRGYFTLYHRGCSFTFGGFIHFYYLLSAYSANQGDQKGLIEYLKFRERIEINNRVTMLETLVNFYKHGDYYPDLLFDLARLNDSADGQKRVALLESDFQGYGPHLSEESKTMLVEGWRALEDPLSEEWTVSVKEKEEKVRELIKQGMSFLDHNVWYRKASILISNIEHELGKEREVQYSENSDFDWCSVSAYALEIGKNIAQIYISDRQSFKLKLFHADALIKTAIESLENNDVPVPVEVWCKAAILKWYQQDQKSAKKYVNKLFEIPLSQKQPGIVYQILMAFLGFLDSNSKEFEFYIKKIPAKTWFEIAKEIVDDAEAVDFVNRWFFKVLSVGGPIPRTVWLIASLLQETTSEWWPNISQSREWISKGLQVPYNKNDDVNEEDYLDLLSLKLGEKYGLSEDEPEYLEQVDLLFAEMISVAADLVQKTPDEPKFPEHFRQFYLIAWEIVNERIRTGLKSHDRQTRARLLAGLCTLPIENGLSAITVEISMGIVDLASLYKMQESWIEEAIAAYDGDPPFWMLEIARKIKQKLSEHSI